MHTTNKLKVNEEMNRLSQTETKENYNAQSIEVLEGLEAVRKRPGMYIGNTNTKGLHHLIWEVLDNSIDEHLSGHGNNIYFTIHKDESITVKDEGRGIPVEIHEKMKMPTVRVVSTILHAGGKFGGGGYKVSGGLHGVGSSVVNALSEFMDIKVSRDGNIYHDRYENGGKPVIALDKKGELPIVGKSNVTGTETRFKPDASIFETLEWDVDLIRTHLREKVFLNSKLTIYFNDERTDETEVFHEEDGIAGFIKELNEDKTTLTNIITFSGISNGIEVDVAFQYTDDHSETIISYCNDIPTHEGGTHVTGIRGGITRLINGYVKELSLAKETFEGKDIRSGFVAVVSIKHPEPQYEGQTKGKLGSSDAKPAVEDVVQREGQKKLDLRIMDLKAIVEHIQMVVKLHKKEENLKVNLQSKEIKLQTNGKLASCLSKDYEKNEIFIVEGDSAGGTAKQGRQRKHQAVMPLRGKILNVEKASMESILNNAEIVSLFSALGCGYGDSFDITKLKYDKVVILTDADVDGSHIRILLLTLFYRFTPELLTKGHIYRGVPPLYKVFFDRKATKAKPNFQYVYSDAELNQLRADGRTTIKSIQRYKGLGEMDAEQLWDTTLDPSTRLLEQITIDSMVESNKITELLMSNKTEPRRNFIVKNAHKANI